MQDVDDRFKGLRLPTMRPPAGLGEDYDFPSNAATLTGLELGTMQLRLSGWFSHSLRVLGREEAELGAIETAYDIALGVKMQEVADGYDKNKPVKETQRALAIQNDPRLRSLTKVIIRKKMLIRQLTAQHEVYKEQLTRLSREQSRREAEARLG